MGDMEVKEEGRPEEAEVVVQEAVWEEAEVEQGVEQAFVNTA